MRSKTNCGPATSPKEDSGISTTAKRSCRWNGFGSGESEIPIRNSFQRETTPRHQDRLCDLPFRPPIRTGMTRWNTRLPEPFRIEIQNTPFRLLSIRFTGGIARSAQTKSNRRRAASHASLTHTTLEGTRLKNNKACSSNASVSECSPGAVF